MNKIIIFAGRDEKSERYTLLIDQEHVTAVYDGGDISGFLEEIATEFGNRIISKTGLVGTMNGYGIIEGKLESMKKVDDSHLRDLRAKLSTALNNISEGRAAIFPMASMN